MCDSRVARLAAALALCVGCPAARDSEGTDVSAADPSDESPRPRADPRPDAPAPTFAAWADWPVTDAVPAAWFGWRIDPTGGFTHSSGLRLTTPPRSHVLAIADGTVRALTVGEHGTTVQLDHGDGVESRYHPLGETLVHHGMPVRRGAALGLAGEAEVTLEIWIGGNPTDPLSIIHSPLQR